MKVIVARVIEFILMAALLWDLIKLISEPAPTALRGWLAVLLFLALLAVNVIFDRCPHCHRHFRYWSHRCPYCGEEFK